MSLDPFFSSMTKEGMQRLLLQVAADRKYLKQQRALEQLKDKLWRAHKKRQYKEVAAKRVKTGRHWQALCLALVRRRFIHIRPFGQKATGEWAETIYPARVQSYREGLEDIRNKRLNIAV